MSPVDALHLEWFAEPGPHPRRVVCTGVFDLLHIGHVRFLTAARAAGGQLVVGIEDEDRTRWRKGLVRPIVPAFERAEVLAALGCVGGVFVIHGPAALWTAEAYAELFAGLRPAALAFTDGDNAEPGKRRAAARLGAELVRVPLVGERSTSELVNRAQSTLIA